MRRAVWPKKFDDDSPTDEQLEPFVNYLQTDGGGMEKSTRDKHVLNVGRFLGALDIEECYSIPDPAVLVSFTRSDLVSIMMRTQIWAA